MDVALFFVLLFTTSLSLIFAQSDNKEWGKNPPVPNLPFNVPASKNRLIHGRRGGKTKDMDGLSGSNEGITNLHGAGDTNITGTIDHLVTPSVTKHIEGSEDNLLDRAIQLLQRLNDRVTAQHALDEQLLRRLETLEYRLTKIEVQMQEKTDVLKTDVREVSQRVRQLDWQSSKMEATLEAIKLDTNGLKLGQDQIRGLQAGSEAKISSIAENELHSKLQMMMTSIYTMRSAIDSIKEDFNFLKVNFTKLSNTTSQLNSMSSQLLTKKYFMNTMLDLKQGSAPSMQALPQIACLNDHGSSADKLPCDCKEVHQEGHNKSGIYRIKPVLSSVPFFVYCQLEGRGGGWTVIQNRYEGTVDFYRDWHDYKHGFGNIGGEFWLGLEKIHALTNYQVTEVLIELQDFNLDTTYAIYSAFAVGTEVEGYPISFLGNYEGDAGDSLVYHAGMKFSTRDMDHDHWPDGNCAESHTGAWWYNGCDTSNLNGRYLNGDLPESFEYQGMYWYDWHGPGYSLMKSRMMIRPGNFSYVKVQDFNNKTNVPQDARQGNPGIDDSPPEEQRFVFDQSYNPDDEIGYE